jgi:signal transduction histidine kinase
MGEPSGSAVAGSGTDLNTFFAGRARPWTAVMLAVVMILIIGSIDLQIDAQLSSTFFYLLPVLLVSRHAGLWASVGCALLATIMSLVANLATSHPTGAPWIPYSDATLRFGVLMVMVRLVRSLRNLNDSLDQRVRDRTARLQAEVKERLKLENRIIEARESEQARIGQDLHDGLCQHLVATAFSAGMLQQRLESERSPGAREASEIVTMIDESITQARDLAKGLYPVPLEEEGLETALRAMAANTTRRTGVQCSVKAEGPPSQLPKEAAIHLYRIAQEALNNAIKHANATAVEIGFRSAGEGFDLWVEDDGRGLDSGARGSGGMGLHIMEYRARVVGARVVISEGKTGGTCVRCASTGHPDPDE